MKKCKKYTNTDSTVTHYRAKPIDECSNCAYFSSKNCGAHFSVESSTTVPPLAELYGFKCGLVLPMALWLWLCPCYNEII